MVINKDDHWQGLKAGRQRDAWTVAISVPPPPPRDSDPLRQAPLSPIPLVTTVPQFSDLSFHVVFTLNITF